MRYFLLALFFLSSVGDGLKKASRINEGVAQARKYYLQEAYGQAMQQYNYLRHSLNVKDDALLLNLAHASYLSGKLETAQKYYNRLRNNPDPYLQGAALNQLALFAFEEGNAEKALYLLKQAIIKNPVNETARYNFELLKKYQAEHPAGLPRRSARKKSPAENQSATKPKTGKGVSEAETGQTDFISDLENEGQEPPQNKLLNEGAKANNQRNNAGNSKDNKPVEAGDTPKSKGNQAGNTEGLQDEENLIRPGLFGANESTEEITTKERQMQTLRKRLRQTDLSAEKAMLLLEAMQNAELQYLQQLPQQQQSRKNKNKPDW